jgi:hypothetical protein
VGTQLDGFLEDPLETPRLDHGTGQYETRWRRLLGIFPHGLDGHAGPLPFLAGQHPVVVTPLTVDQVQLRRLVVVTVAQYVKEMVAFRGGEKHGVPGTRKLGMRIAIQQEETHASLPRGDGGGAKR